MSTSGTPHIYAHGLDESTWRALPDHERCDCGDCTWRGRLEDTNIIRDIHERMSEGDPMAAGECPECGALANSAAMHAQWKKETDQIAAARAMLAALTALHSCHRAFSGNDNWTALDDEARAATEAAIDQAEAAGIKPPETRPEPATIHHIDPA